MEDARRIANWRDKLHPMFFEVAALNRSFEVEFKRIDLECKRALKDLGKNPSVERRAKILRDYSRRTEGLVVRLGEQLDEINSRYCDVPDKPVAFSYLDPPPGEPIVSEQGLVRYLHWMRHHESLDRTCQRDAEGDLTAIDAIARTAKDWRRITHGKGPIKSFQGDTVHRQLLELIICFEASPLTADERAECVDAYCACGKEHDADALKKQYRRLKRELEAVFLGSTRGGNRLK